MIFIGNLVIGIFFASIIFGGAWLFTWFYMRNYSPCASKRCRAGGGAAATATTTTPAGPSSAGATTVDRGHPLLNLSAMNPVPLREVIGEDADPTVPGDQSDDIKRQLVDDGWDPKRAVPHKDPLDY